MKHIWLMSKLPKIILVRKKPPLEAFQYPQFTSICEILVYFDFNTRISSLTFLSNTFA